MSTKKALASSQRFSFLLLFWLLSGSLLPNLFSNVFDEGNLLPLIFGFDDVALFGGRKAALGADAEVAQRNVLGRLFNAMLQIGRVFQGAIFRGNQTEDYLLICDVVQWAKIARALRVVLEEKAVNLQIGEQDRRYGVISAGREMGIRS